MWPTAVAQTSFPPPPSCRQPYGIPGKALGLPQINGTIFDQYAHSRIMLRPRQTQPLNFGLLKSFLYASFAIGTTDRNSTSDKRPEYNLSPIEWNCKKQSLVAVSTTEPEYTALAAGVQETDTTKRLLTQLHIARNYVPLFKNDNQESS